VKVVWQYRSLSVIQCVSSWIKLKCIWCALTNFQIFWGVPKFAFMYVYKIKGTKCVKFNKLFLKYFIYILIFVCIKKIRGQSPLTNKEASTMVMCDVNNLQHALPQKGFLCLLFWTFYICYRSDTNSGDVNLHLLLTTRHKLRLCLTTRRKRWSSF